MRNMCQCVSSHKYGVNICGALMTLFVTYLCDVDTYLCDVDTYLRDVYTYLCDVDTYSCDVYTYVTCKYKRCPHDIVHDIFV